MSSTFRFAQVSLLAHAHTTSLHLFHDHPDQTGHFLFVSLALQSISFTYHRRWQKVLDLSQHRLRTVFRPFKPNLVDALTYHTAASEQHAEVNEKQQRSLTEILGKRPIPPFSDLTLRGHEGPKRPGECKRDTEA
ncbi:hypothetical protein IWX49DRAFT_616106 [Phyllosticta citricarpa]